MVYDTNSESDVHNDTPSGITVSRSGRTIHTHFRLDLQEHLDDQVWDKKGMTYNCHFC